MVGMLPFSGWEPVSNVGAVLPPPAVGELLPSNLYAIGVVGRLGSGSLPGIVHDYLNRRKLPEDEKLRLKMEDMAYMLCNHYGWSLPVVHGLSLDALRQAFSWAMAMNQMEEPDSDGEIVYVGYDHVPELR